MARERLKGTEADLAALLEPRDNILVRESVGDEPPDGSEQYPDRGVRHFYHCEGPFEHYERTVTWRREPDGVSVEQALCFRLAIPYWGWLYRLPAARALRRGLAPDVRPWWAPPDRFTPAQARVAAAVCALNVVGGMLYGLLTQVLTFVSVDLGDGSSGEQTRVLAAVRAGIVVTLVVALLADRVGRRRTALGAFGAAAVITLVTAAAPSLPFVTIAQFFSRNLAVGALLCADTIAIEEMPAGSRAMIAGIGTLAYGLGAGLVVMTLPLADVGIWGWRLTFVAAGVSLPVVLHTRRYLPESRRYQLLRLDRREQPSDGRSGSSAVNAGTVNLGAGTTGAGTGSLGTTGRWRLLRRLLLVGSIFVLLNVFLAPASQLQNDYLRTRVGFSATTMTIFILLTSTPGGIGVVLGGQVADRYGRRWAIIPGLSALAVFYTIMFATTDAWLWISSLVASIIGGMAAPALAVITAELFPTVRRATIRGLVTGLAVAGSIIGLLLGGELIDSLGYATAFALLAAAPLAAVVLTFFLPQTHKRELEETSA